MEMDCINCVHADVSHNEERMIKYGNTTIIQRGTNNITCKEHGMHISFNSAGDMECSMFMPKGSKTETYKLE